MTDTVITNLRRIASGMKLTEAGDFSRMSRADMIALARAACRAADVSFGAKPAWRGAMPPVKRKTRKIRLTPRASPELRME